MAIGTPSKQRAARVAPLELAFPGKEPASAVLARRGAVLHQVRGSGEAGGSRLIWSENLSALLALAGDPEVSGQVRLVYLDPPFATRSVFRTREGRAAYEDVLVGSAFVEFLRERLIVLHSLLARDGSLYLHLDDKMVFPMKLVLDEVFGAAGFRNCIVRKKCNPKNFTRRAFGNVVDYVLFYTKSDDYVWNRQFEAWTEGRAREYQYEDEATGRRYMKVPVHAPGTRNGETGQPWRGRPPPPGKHWQYPPRVLDELDARGEIYWSPSGNPRRKVYLDQSEGVSVQDLWLDLRDAHNQNVRITGYPTEKNLGLLSRIVSASSNPGDLVLDAFAGSGTTLVAAEALGRRWIGIDEGQTAIEATLRRFALGTRAMGDFVGPRPGPPANAPPPVVERFAFLAAEEHAEAARALCTPWQAPVSTPLPGARAAASPGRARPRPRARTPRR